MEIKVRFILVDFLERNQKLVVACQDENSYMACIVRLNSKAIHSYEITLECARSLIQHEEGIGAGVYLTEPDNCIVSDCRRSEALHKYIRFMLAEFKEVTIHEPIALVL